MFDVFFPPLSALFPFNPLSINKSLEAPNCAQPSVHVKQRQHLIYQEDTAAAARYDWWLSSRANGATSAQLNRKYVSGKTYRH